MCGRFTETRPVEEVEQRFVCRSDRCEAKPRYNIAPGQAVPVVVSGAKRLLRNMHWGLVPYWADSERSSLQLINARAETVAEKPAFKHPFQCRRCLVPADGFYEWKKESGQKRTPYRFTLKSGQLFAFAGIWDLWESHDGRLVHSFAIITTMANDVIRPVHDRMPVILSPGEEAAWLAPDTPADMLKTMLKPYVAEFMKSGPVSARVNSPHHDDPACIRPADQQASCDDLPLWNLK